MPNYAQSSTIGSLFKKGRPVYFQKSDVILGTDPQPTGIYYIDSGFVKTYSITDTGDQFLHVVYGHGEIFPLSWAYLGLNTELYYEALDDTLLWRISKEQFVLFATKNARGSFELAKQMAHQFQLFSDRLDNLEYKTSSERVAYRLLFLAGRFGKRQGRKIMIEAPVTHELIAQSINLARESVSREIGRLEQRNIISRVGHHLIINDIDKLSQQLSKPSSVRYWGID